MRLHKAFTPVLAVLVLAACEKDGIRDLTAPLPSAGIRFFNFAVHPTGTTPSVQFYAGDRKITATSSTLCQFAADPPVTANDTVCVTIGRQATTGVGYGGVGSGGLYSGIEPGQYTFASRLVSDYTTVVSSAQATIEPGKFYSYYVSGFYNATSRTADAFVVEDNFPSQIDWTVANVRFVNAISNSQQPMTLFITNTQTGQEITIGGQVAYKAASSFVTVPPGAYDLRTRYAGSTTNQIVRTGVPFEPGRVYTITARGDITVTSTTATNRPFLDNTVNR
jgi:hypothetical protein